MESKAKKILWLLYPAVMGLIWYTQLPRILLMTGTTAMQYFVISLVSVLSIAILNLLRFRLPDFLLLFTVIFMVVSKPDFVEGFSDFLIFFLIFGIGTTEKSFRKAKFCFHGSHLSCMWQTVCFFGIFMTLSKVFISAMQTGLRLNIWSKQGSLFFCPLLWFCWIPF